MATKITEQEVIEMIWRADTNERIEIAKNWVKRNLKNERTKDRLCKLCRARSKIGNDRKQFELTVVMIRLKQEYDLTR